MSIFSDYVTVGTYHLYLKVTKIQKQRHRVRIVLGTSDKMKKITTKRMEKKSEHSQAHRIQR